MIDPDATILDLPIDPDAWEPPSGDDYDDYPDGDGHYSPWLRPAYEPMTLDDYEAMRALGLAY